jgi:NAD(P)H-hydrate epimerase
VLGDATGDRALRREQVRELDRRAIARYGMSGLVLMENAGRGCADVLCREGIHGPVVIFCGVGNNGGDGFVIARHLQLRGHSVRVGLPGDPARMQGDARSNFEILRRCDVPLTYFAQADDARLATLLDEAAWIVDALLGTGARGDPRPPLDWLIPRLNDSPGKRLAVDLPSGLDCDTGVPAATTFRAHHTATFVAPKWGFAEPSARACLGRVHVLDIGAPRRLLEEFLT